jgi:hypothetical protein
MQLGRLDDQGDVGAVPPPLRSPSRRRGSHRSGADQPASSRPSSKLWTSWKRDTKPSYPPSGHAESPFRRGWNRYAERLLKRQIGGDARAGKVLD